MLIIWHFITNMNLEVIWIRRYEAYPEGNIAAPGNAGTFRTEMILNNI